jgi:CheY-like chemotaxis protein
LGTPVLTKYGIVLLVEDNPGDVMLIRQVLRESKQPVRLLTAMDGEQAIGMLSDPEFRPALVILDLYIPRVSSRTVLQRYRERGVPVVIFTSASNEMEKLHALEHGAVDFISKPKDLPAFGDTIRRMVEKWARV